MVSHTFILITLLVYELTSLSWWGNGWRGQEWSALDHHEKARSVRRTGQQGTAICVQQHIFVQKRYDTHLLSLWPSLNIFLVFQNPFSGKVDETFRTPYTPQHKIGGRFLVLNGLTWIFISASESLVVGWSLVKIMGNNIICNWTLFLGKQNLTNINHTLPNGSNRFIEGQQGPYKRPCRIKQHLNQAMQQHTRPY